MKRLTYNYINLQHAINFFTFNQSTSVAEGGMIKARWKTILIYKSRLEISIYQANLLSISSVNYCDSNPDTVSDESYNRSLLKGAVIGHHNNGDYLWQLNFKALHILLSSLGWEETSSSSWHRHQLVQTLREKSSSSDFGKRWLWKRNRRR